MPTAMKSTDRDLLVAQNVLSAIRWPDKKELRADALERRKKAAVIRFVQENFGDGALRTVQARTKDRDRMVMYDLGVTYQINNIPFDGKKYRGKVTFTLRNVPGAGKTTSARLQDAKERFRKYLVTNLRAKKSSLRTAFFKVTAITFMNGHKTELSAQDLTKVVEKFRLWIGNSLWRINSTNRQKFPKAVRHEEVQLSYICTECGIRKFSREFNSGHFKETGKRACVECVPYPDEEDDPDDDDEDLEDDLDEEEDEE